MSLAQDVAHLKANPGTETKAEITEKITHYYHFHMFDPKERVIAEDIIRLLSKDINSLIRKIIVKNLKSCEDLPHEIALRLAKDLEDDVAIPMLQLSPVLKQEDLIEIVRSTKQVSRLKAISNRTDVGEELSEALLDTQAMEVIDTLVKNMHAQLGDHAKTRIIETYSGEGGLITALVKRGSLSPKVVATLMSTVSGSLMDQIKEKYSLDPNTAYNIANDAFEESILDLFGNAKQRSQTEELVQQLHKEETLTSTVIFRALCRGDVIFFIHSLAVLTGKPLKDVHHIILEKLDDEFEKLYKKANLPTVAERATKIIWPMVIDAVKSGALKDKTFATQLKQQIEEEGYSTSVPMMRHFLVFINTQKPQ